MAAVSPNPGGDGSAGVQPSFPLTDNQSLAFGEFLREAREHRGLTLEQISRETKIPSRHLEALEHGRLASVPGGVYRRAEVRAYAQVVGLDQRLALTELEQALAATETPRERAPERPRPGRAKIQGLSLALVALGSAAAVAYATWTRALTDHDAPRGDRAAAPSPTSVVRPPTTPPVTSLAASAPAAVPSQGSSVRDPVTAPTSAAENAPIARPADVDGELVVTTDPPGARVTVNGIGRGTTPLTVRYLPLGEVRIRISKDGHLSRERVVQLDAGRPRVALHVPLSEARAASSGR